MKYFKSLDRKRRGSIDYKDLEEPLLSFGIADNEYQVKELIKSADVDISEQIKFEKFLKIVKGKKENEPITRFFKELIDGELMKDSRVLPFRTVVSSYRRKMILNAFVCEERKAREKGEKIMKAYAKSISTRNRDRNTMEDFYLAETKTIFPKYKRIIEEEVPNPFKNRSFFL